MQLSMAQINDLKAAAKAAVDPDTLDQLAAGVLSDIVLETMKKYQLKLNVGVQDSVSDLLDNFKTSMTTTLVNALSKWKLPGDDIGVFPDNCRFYFKKGDHTVIVIEAPPSVRTLTFTYDQFNCPGTNRYTLGLPYSVFVVHFDKDKFAGLYHGWRRQPLRSIDDHVSPPCLPNTHSNFAVCVSEKTYSGNLGEQVSQIVADFWASSFNHDLETFFLAGRNMFATMSSMSAWEQNTELNPLFILGLRLEDVGENRSVRDTLDLITTYAVEKEVVDIRKKITEEVDEVTGLLFARIMRYFKNTKFDRYHPTAIKEALAGHFSKSNEHLTNLLIATENKLLQATKISEPEPTPDFIPVSSYWSDGD